MSWKSLSRPISLIEIREHPPNSRHPWSILSRPKIPPTIETHTPSMASSLVTKIRTTTTRCGTIRSFSWCVIAYPKRGGNRVAADALAVRERGQHSRRRLRELLVDQFLDSFDTPPSRLVLDLDGFDDLAHGQQQLTLFHGYYEQNQYFPLIITNAETGLVVMVSLRHGTAHASLAADEDLEFVVTKTRRRCPDVDIEVRVDSGFGVPAMYEVCERLRVWYTFELRMNLVSNGRAKTSWRPLSPNTGEPTRSNDCSRP
ncbi:MAG: transposase [Planctomycetaceae bacterium]